MIEYLFIHKLIICEIITTIRETNIIKNGKDRIQFPNARTPITFKRIKGKECKPKIAIVLRPIIFKNFNLYLLDNNVHMIRSMHAPTIAFR